MSLLLALCLALTLIPSFPRTAAAPAESDPGDRIASSLDKLVEWGVMRGDTDGGLHPDRSLTRAEFAALVNRAYGYTQTGPTPFTDVPASAWYADDIGIAYNAGYFLGTGPTTAGPTTTLTREQAAVLLARSLRLKEVPGQAIELSDGNDVSDWARGYIRAAAQAGIVDDNDGNGFRPRDIITRGEMADLLAGCVGSLIQTPGQHSLGSVYGNVTINKAGTTLKDTVIAGDLYVTGGVDLGGITLENTTVLGKIVVAGGGESEGGQDSIILRNVEADGLILDSIKGQYNSLRAEGDTSIMDTVLRTSAYVQDRTDAGYGLLNLTLDSADPNASFTLSGNLNDIVNKTPGAEVIVAQAAVDSLTMDEKAVGSTLRIDPGAVVRKLNLDTAVPVTGSGDVDNLQVNTLGSSTEMLPDKVAVRPGLVANVAGTDMDPGMAQESSSDPRLLAGYPRMKNIAPTSATAVFSANKPGTVYWAVSALVDGSIPEEELLEPKTYGSKAVKQGSVEIKTSNTEVSVPISNLTKGGTYYLSAVMVDARGQRSPLKVVSFSTPDDTVPAFAQGYPSITKVTNVSAQVGVMTTKSCILHYAVFPKGAAAPSVNDFKTGALTGNLGSGQREMTRNIPDYFYVENPRNSLEELKSYDLYLWLVDADGTKSSAIQKLSFTTVDKTPPVITSELTLPKVAGTSLSGSVTVNEDGTLFWVAVPAGTEYPKPQGGEKPALSSNAAKIMVANGNGAFKSGKVTVKADKDTAVTISGLKSESAYDIYYVAQDKAGNYSEVVKVLLNQHTLDATPPDADQYFDHVSEDDQTRPFADTRIDIIFTETVQYATDNIELLKLYQAVQAAGNDAEEQAARNSMANVLRSTILLYNANNTSSPVTERLTDTQAGDWVIDYRYAEITMDSTDPDGKRMIVSFWGRDTGTHTAALNLKSGSTYYFRLQNLADTSAAKNVMRTKTLKRFTTISAQAELKPLNQTTAIDAVGMPTLPVENIDLAFTMTPRSASTVDDINYDMLLWCDASVTFELYYQEPGDSWRVAPLVGEVSSNTEGQYRGVSLYRDLMGSTTFPLLNSLQDDKEYKFAIHITSISGSPESDRLSWTRNLNFRVQVVTGNIGDLDYQSQRLGMGYHLESGVSDISSPADFTLRKQFTDKTAPRFIDGFPKFIDVGDKTATMQVQVNRPATVYYVVAPVGMIDTLGPAPALDEVYYDNPNVPHMNNGNLTPRDPFFVTQPNRFYITEPNYNEDNGIIVGKPQSVGTGAVPIRLDRAAAGKYLLPDTDYFVYVVLEGAGGGKASDVMLYRFHTQVENPLVIELDMDNPTVYITPNRAAITDYIMVRWDNSSLSSLLKAKLKDPGVLKAGASNELTANELNMTVLEAMATDVSENNISRGSLFDIYGDSAYKTRVASYIAASQAGGNGDIVGTKHNDTIAENYRKRVHYSDPEYQWKLSQSTQYAFLVCGRAVNDPTSGYAFRAIYPVFLRDTAAPIITSIIPDSIPENAEFPVTVQINFNENLYYYTPGGGNSPSTTQLVDLGPLTRSSTSAVSAASLAQNITSSVISVYQGGKVGQTTTSIVLSVQRVINVDCSISFRPNISDIYNNVREDPLVVTFKYVKDDDTHGHFEIKIPKSWDGSAGQIYSK